LHPLRKAAATEATFTGGFLHAGEGSEKNLKKKAKTICGIKKGSYICTRLARKRAGETKKQVHRHIELTA
jgi:hypothetical protein